MAWNEPDNQKDDKKDPWSGKNDGPPDLDEHLKQLQQKLKRLLGGRKTSSGSGQDGQGGGALVVGLVLGVLGLLWVLSGIFIVGPAEQAAILRFGKYVETVGPGPHWIPRFIESKVVKNVDKMSHYSYKSQMLTKDENLVDVALVVQYRIGDLNQYLFSATDPIESLQQATASALRQVIGHTPLDQIITEGREVWGQKVAELLRSILDQYQVGILITDVSPQPARAPVEVQDAFDAAINAQEDEKRYKEQALAYEANVVPIAKGQAKRIIQDADAYRQKVVLAAKGDVAEFLAILPEYLKAPNVTSLRMYLSAMEGLLSRTSKVVVESKAGNMFYLPLDKWMKGSTSINTDASMDSATKSATPISTSSSSNIVPLSTNSRSYARTYTGRRGY